MRFLTWLDTQNSANAQKIRSSIVHEVEGVKFDATQSSMAPFTGAASLAHAAGAASLAPDVSSPVREIKKTEHQEGTRSYYAANWT